MKKSEWVAAQLRQQICAGTYTPGEKLPSETKLCEQFGVSRLTVRSALGSLAAQEMIETRKGSGSIVRAQRAAGAEFESAAFGRMGLFEFRRILETEIAGLAAQRADAETVETLSRLTAQMQTAAQNTDIALYDAEFHRTLAAATHNAVIMRVFELLAPAFQTMMEQNVDVLGTEGCEAHLQIVSAIGARNSELAKKAMCWHLNHTVELTNMLNFRAAEEKR